MLYYKTIDIDDYDTIIEKCLSYVKSLDKVYTRSLPEASWYTLNFVELYKHCPELITSFKKYDLKINMVAAYVMYSTIHSSVHVDSHPSEARINLPLLNCDGTYTNFYSSDNEPVEWINPDSGVKSYLVNGDYKLVDRVELKQATVIRTQVLHRVDLPIDNPVPRITLTLGFTRDPVYLLVE